MHSVFSVQYLEIFKEERGLNFWIAATFTLPPPPELASELQRMATLISYHLAKSNSVCSPATDNCYSQVQEKAAT